MIKIDQIAFENYDRAFDFISEMDGNIEEGNLLYLPFETGNNWSFVTYSPERIKELSQFDPMTEPPLRQAYEGQWGLLEFCAGNYRNPQYIALTPDVDVQGLKKKWLQNYCAAHGLAIRECAEVSGTPSHVGQTAGENVAERRNASC